MPNHVTNRIKLIGEPAEIRRFMGIIKSDEFGLFISMPSTSYTTANGEKKYQDIFHPTTKCARDALNTSVLNAYKAALAQSQQPEIEVQDTPDEDESEEPVYDEPDPDPVMSM